MSTETELRAWREGSTKAERLCAGVLSISGFTDIDPQAPLGGPDDKKDILARKDGHQFVAAVFFPPTDKTFAGIKKKFVEDRAGVSRHDAEGFVFFVNEPLSLGDRAKLLQLGGPLDEIFHLERLRHILDSPAGYGLRLEYLGREMTAEEQLAYFQVLRSEMLQQQSEAQLRLEAKVETMIARTESALMEMGVRADPSSITGGNVAAETNPSLEGLTLAQLQLLHRAVTEGSSLPDEVRGVTRRVPVWIGDAAKPVYEPPPPEDVVPRLNELLAWWREIYPSLHGAELSETIAAMARMHYEMVAIHPFLDGNGRLARFVTDQTARDLLKRSVGRELVEDHQQYFEALKSANAGDLHPLQQLIRTALI